MTTSAGASSRRSRIEEYDRQVVLPHEYTRQEWVLDRVRLMGVTGYNYSSLLVLFRDDLRSTVGGILRAVAGGEPTAIAAPPDMPELRMWRLSDPGTIEVLANSFAQNQLFIADGHHRYEAALRFRSRIRSEREVDPGRVDQLPHDDARVSRRARPRHPRLSPHGPKRVRRRAFDDHVVAAGTDDADGVGVRADASAATKFAESLANMTGDEPAFGLYGLEKGVCHVARLEPAPPTANELERSEYSRLHDLVFRQTFSPDREAETVTFSYEPERAMKAVDDGEAQLAIIMRPVPMSEFMGIVTRGWRLPPKATNFHPKPSAGSVIQSLEGPL